MDKKIPQRTRSPQKFRPAKRDVHNLLDPDVLDDDTRRMLFEEVMNARPVGLTPVEHSNNANVRVPRTHNVAVEARAAGSHGHRSIAPPSNGGLPSPKPGDCVRSIAVTPHAGGEEAEGVFPSQLRSRVKGSEAENGLITSMAARLADLERKHTAYQSELKEMHAKYRVLNDKYQKEMRVRDEAENLVITLYEEKKESERELTEMRAFLADYGLEWRGSGDTAEKRGKRSSASPTQARNEVATSTGTQQSTAQTFDLYAGDFTNAITLSSKAREEEDGDADDDAKGPVHFLNTAKKGTKLFSLRTPQDDVNRHQRRGHGGIAVDVQLLIKNARILSDYVGWTGFVKDGNKGGIRDRDVVRVVVYKNGICVNGGPFRPYGWPLCEAFVNDLAEGYYPYEFKEKYPDGFPIEVVDRSEEDCEAGKKPLPAAMAGGKRLGGGDEGDAKAMRQSPTQQQSNVRTFEDISGSAYKTIPMDEFLKKVPARKITAEGRLVNVRDGVAALVGKSQQHSGGGHGMGTVKHVTPAEAAFLEQASSSPLPSEVGAGMGGNLIMCGLVAILVRMPSGQKLTLHMRPDNTVAELRREFVKAMPEFASQRYEFCQSFPSVTLTDHSKTLAELGMTKSCTLMVRVQK